VTEVYYERIPMRHERKGSFKIPLDVIDKLGGGERYIGAAILADVFGVHPLHGAVLDAEALARLGDGDVKAGARVLRKFIANIRQQQRKANAGTAGK
jgi:hypothetical protein